MSVLAVGISKLTGVAPSGVHSWRHNLKVLQIDALPVSAQVVYLQPARNLAALGLVVPLVGIDLSAVLVFECAVSGGVEGASPLPAARVDFIYIFKKANIRVGFRSPAL